jgi:hypothetical protein
MLKNMVKIAKPESCRGCPVSDHKNTLIGGVPMTNTSLPKSSSKINQKRLKELLDYDPETGLFHWKANRRGGSKANDLAGHKRSDGYIEIRIDGKAHRASRLAFLFIEGYLPEHEIDHINRVRDDNRWFNLRHVSHICNMRNKSVRQDNTSGITGVSWDRDRNKWQTHIAVNGDNKFLGRFNDLKKAVHERWKAEIMYGFPGCNSTSPAFQFLEDLNV